VDEDVVSLTNNKIATKTLAILRKKNKIREK